MSESRDARLVNVLGALALAVNDRVRVAIEADAGMSGAAPAALVALEQFLGGQTTVELARAAGLTHSGAVRLVDRLVELGLVERRPGRDGRSLAIVLTRSGRTMSRRLSAARSKAIEATLEDLDERDRQALLPLVDTLLATVTRHRLDARRRGDELPGWLCRLCDFDACGRAAGACPATRTATDEARRHLL